jgi:CRP-like cAMP-binding protein
VVGGTAAAEGGQPRHSLLDRLSVDERERILQIGVRRRYRKGVYVVHAGDTGDTLHLILRGRVAVQIDTDRGGTAILTFLGEGSCFGELAMLRGGVRSASVVALEPLETLTLSKNDLEQVHDDGRVVQRFLIEVLVSQVNRLTERVLEAQAVSAEQRVVRRLLDVAQAFDTGDLPIVVPISQTVLAGLADTTRPTANKALGRLATLGLIRSRRASIELLEPDGLRAFAGRG